MTEIHREIWPALGDGHVLSDTIEITSREPKPSRKRPDFVVQQVLVNNAHQPIYRLTDTAQLY